MPTQRRLELVAPREKIGVYVGLLNSAFVAATVRLGRDMGRLRTMGAAACAAVQGLSPQQVAADLDSLLLRLHARIKGHAGVAAA